MLHCEGATEIGRVRVTMLHPTIAWPIVCALKWQHQQRQGQEDAALRRGDRDLQGPLLVMLHPMIAWLTACPAGAGGCRIAKGDV